MARGDSSPVSGFASGGGKRGTHTEGQGASKAYLGFHALLWQDLTKPLKTSHIQNIPAIFPGPVIRERSGKLVATAWKQKRQGHG